MIVPVPFDTPGQVDLSRAAADRYALHEATRSPSSGRPYRPVLNRLRHALALRLISTARAIDAH